jgi:LPXTG-motif cell wall-anchored protein
MLAALAFFTPFRDGRPLLEIRQPIHREDDIEIPKCGRRPGTKDAYECICPVRQKEAETMKISRIGGMIFRVTILVAALGFHTQAQTLDKLTFFTFSKPVEVPGGKVLPAGTYAFKVLDTVGTHNIVQIFDKNQQKLYAMVLAVPDYRVNPTDKPVITFSETAQGGPVAIKEWFYPGFNYGQEFVYPKTRAVELAKASNQPVPSMPNETASNITQPANMNTAPASNVQGLKDADADVKAEEPGGNEVEVAEVFVTEAPVAEAAIVAKELPKTASSLPLIGVAGFSLILAGGLFWLVSKRTV